MRLASPLLPVAKGRDADAQQAGELLLGQAQLLLRSKTGEARAAGTRHHSGDWVSKGVRFPQGTQARAKYKGQLHLAEVRDGALMLNGKRYESPSSAAMAITNNKPVNGWTFWEVKLPGHGDWQTMKDLRPEI